jgi:hypothetical protein
VPVADSASSRPLAFLIAGVQKCGTSALDAYLRRHPGIQMAQGGKELHFFDDETQDWASPDYDELHRHYEDDDRLRGEATPITVYWTPSHARVRRYNPAMKLILLFRDPALRAFSQWRKEYTRHMEPLEFGAAIREGRGRVAREAGAPGDATRLFSYVERGLYGAQIRALLDHFPREQLLFLTSHDLLKRQGDTLARVCAFLGVSPFEHEVPEAIVNPGRPLDRPFEISAADWRLLANIYRDDLETFCALTEVDISGWPTASRH